MMSVMMSMVLMMSGQPDTIGDIIVIIITIINYYIINDINAIFE